MAWTRRIHMENISGLVNELTTQEKAALLEGVLPLTGREKLLVVGEMFEKMRYQGAGSSLINPPKAATPKDPLAKRMASGKFHLINEKSANTVS